MRSIRSMIGLPVLMEGKPIGHLVDVELDEELKRMTGLYLDGGLSGTRRVAKEQVKLLGQVSVMVADKGQRARPKEARLRRALTTDGSRVGAVTGALINERTQGVEALELTRGYLDDLMRGRQWIFRYAVNRTSGDVLIMPEGGEIE